MTKTRSIISETIIGKDEPLQPFRSAMIRDTEDVVALLQRLREPISVRVSAPTNPDGPAAADLIEALLADRQSLSDRIDVLTQALKPFVMDYRHAGVPNIVPDDALWAEVDFDNTRLRVGDFRRARAALHQEGIAP